MAQTPRTLLGVLESSRLLFWRDSLGAALASLLQTGVLTLNRPRGGIASESGPRCSFFFFCVSVHPLCPFQSQQPRCGRGVASSSASRLGLQSLAAEMAWPSPCLIWNFGGREMMGLPVSGVHPGLLREGWVAWRLDSSSGGECF